MALTMEEMRARWASGNQDLNGDGGVNLFDIQLAIQFAQEAGENAQEATEGLVGDVLAHTTT